jgi:hypothetical protein
MCKLAVGLLALIVSAPALAEPIPRENVVQIYRECVSQAPGNQQIARYCECYANQIGDKLSVQLALTINGEVQAQRARGVSPIAATRSQPELWNITQECRVSVGLPRIP